MFAGMTVEIPLGQDGLVGIDNPAVLLPSHLLEANYVSFQGQRIRKEGGQSPFTPSALGTSVLNGHDWWTPTEQRQVALLGDGTVRKDSGSGTFPVTLVSGLTVTKPSQFVDAGAEATGKARKLFLFTGTNAPQVLSGDGATMTAMATPAADWTGTNQPLCGAVHANRLWAAGNLSDPASRVFLDRGQSRDFHRSRPTPARFPSSRAKATALPASLAIVGCSSSARRRGASMSMDTTGHPDHVLCRQFSVTRHWAGQCQRHRAGGQRCAVPR